MDENEDIKALCFVTTIRKELAKFRGGCRPTQEMFRWILV